jgi:hypothetical protein
VFYFKVSRTVRECIRHAQEGYREEKAGIKLDYMRKRCEELDCHVVSELEGKIKAAAAAAAAAIVKRKWDEVADGAHKFDRPKRVAQPTEGISSHWRAYSSSSNIR